MVQRRKVFELEGLKFEIGKLKVEVGGEDGEQEITAALTEGLTRAISPVAEVLRPQLEAPAPTITDVVATSRGEKRRTRRGSRARGAGSTATNTALDWKPNTTANGNPHASWSSGKKALWLLHCYSKENGGPDAEPNGLTLAVIVATFNKHFPHAKTIQSSHVSRDFQRFAAANPPKVVANRNVVPPVWYPGPGADAVVEELVKGSPTPLFGSPA